MPHSVRLLSLVLLVLTACPDNPDDTPDAGEQEVPDLCNSKEEALSSPECQLVLGQQMERYISFGGDQDWYSVQMPSTVGVRSLVRVTALYDTPFTAVNLSVKFQRENGDSLVLEKVDMHGQGQPRPIEFTIPFTEPGAKLLLLLADKPSNTSRPGFDVRNPYFLKVEVLENPDSLEPNDAPELATPVALTNQNGVLVGSSTGYLATPGDVDRFSFNVPVGKIVYVHLTAPYLAPPEQPPAYIFSYKLLRPDQTAEVDRRARTNVVAVDLATARRVETGGTWQVLVQAWDSDGPGNEPPPGDVRLQYTLDVRVMDEADPNDKAGGNEVMAKARVGVMDKTAPPAKVTTAEFTGRLGSEKDLDWYVVEVPTYTAPSVLHYRLVSLAGTGGRFPALPSLQNRLVYVLAEVPGSSATDCATKAEVCPKGYGANRALFEPLVSGWCNQSTPLCLHSSREESEYFSNLRNFEGTLPVASHATNVRYYFLVQDEGTDWAEDKDYRLEVEWLADPDEASPQVGSKQLASDDGAASFPHPPTGDAFEVHGAISHGQGRLVNNDPVKGQGVRGPMDYDAIPTDVDTFTFTLPSPAEPMDRTWELQWEVANLPDGGTPYGLALDLTFCDGDRPDAGATCTPVSTGSAGQPLTLAYRGESLRAWHSPAGSLSNLQPLYGLERSGGFTRVTVQPYACSCLEPRFLRGGTLKVAVSGVDRLDYGQADYTLRTAHTAYPKSFTTTDGGTATCPRPDAGVASDGGTFYTPGCVFSRQP